MEKEEGMHNEKHSKYAKGCSVEDDDSHQDSDEDNTSFTRTHKESEETHVEKRKECAGAPRRKRTLLHRCPFNHRCSHSDVKKRESENFNVNTGFRKECTSVSKSDLEKISNLLQANTVDDTRYLYHAQAGSEMETFHADESASSVSEYNIRLIQRGLKGVSCQDHSTGSYAYSRDQFLPPHLLSSSAPSVISKAQPSCSCPNPCCASALSKNVSSFSLPVSPTCPSASPLLSQAGHAKKHRTTPLSLKSAYVKRINKTAKAFASLGNREVQDLLQQLPSPVGSPSAIDHSVQGLQELSLAEASFANSSSEQNLLVLANKITSSFRQSCRNFFVEKLCPGATESEVRQVVSAVECLEARVYSYNSSSKSDYCVQLATKFCCIQDELENTSKSSHPDAGSLKDEGSGLS